MRLLGVDIGATKTEIALLDQEGNILASHKIFSKEIFKKASSPAVALTEHLLAFCQHIDVQIHDLFGIGIGVPGDIDQNTHRIGTCPNLPILNGLRLEPELRQLLDAPVLIENDVNLICYGEYKAGNGKRVEHLACLYVGTGIGCGLIIDGNLYTGADGAAGEVGHSILFPDGRQCNCGQKGCLEMYCSGKALAGRAASVLPENYTQNDVRMGEEAVQWVDAEVLINAARSGHTKAIEELQISFYYLGLGVVNLVNLFNPRLVILGGGILDGWPEGIDIVSSVVRNHARSIVRDHLLIERPVLGARAGLVGASFLLQDRVPSPSIP